MVKKFINKNIFLSHNKEILTKGLVIFKRWYGVKDEKFDCYGGSLKKSIFRGGEGFKKKQYILGNCLKHCLGLGQFEDLRRGLAKKRWGCFWAWMILHCKLWTIMENINGILTWNLKLIYINQTRWKNDNFSQF